MQYTVYEVATGLKYRMRSILIAAALCAPHGRARGYTGNIATATG